MLSLENPIEAKIIDFLVEGTWSVKKLKKTPGITIISEFPLEVQYHRVEELSQDKICANCVLFHPETTNQGIEASITGTILSRENPKTSVIQYGRMGCFDDAYGQMSISPCTELDKFEPRS